MNRMTTIDLPIFLKMGTVHCYLLESQSGYLLIDSGGPNSRKALEAALTQAGCEPGSLKLVVLTHGDFDHTGNAAHLRQKYKALLAMHPDDRGMAEEGDMFFNRQQPNLILRTLIKAFSGFGKAERFQPDVLLQEGDDLSAYGFEARVISIPGHSRGSIGILTAAGDLFSGDLLVNHGQPVLNDLMDDPVAAHFSVEKLKRLAIRKIYPGHGEPFTPDEIPSGDGAS